MIFSVAVPVFKQAEFLPTALASVAAQSSAFQLTVMDATPDHSVQDVLTRYVGEVHYTRHGPDSGQAAAIQEGWDHSTGDVLYWLCADDYLFPYAFQEVEKVFRERPDVDVVYGDSVYVNEAGHFLRYFPSINSNISAIVKDCCISQPSCFVRRQAVERVGNLNSELHYIMDWDLWTRLFKAGARFRYLRKPLSVTRIYDGTKTTSHSEKRFFEIRRHLARHAGYFFTLRSMVGFYMVGFHYPELGRGAASLPGQMAFGILNSLQRIKTALPNYNAARESKTLYGLDTRTNRVRGQCHIYLAEYGSDPPTSVIVTTTGNVDLDATVDAVPLLQITAGTDGRLNRHVFKLPRAERLRKHFVRMSLTNSKPADWNLVSVALE
jgi:GT2 family glycosyltransferase